MKEMMVRVGEDELVLTPGDAVYMFTGEVTDEINKYSTDPTMKEYAGAVSYVYIGSEELRDLKRCKKVESILLAIRQPGMTIGYLEVNYDGKITNIKIYESAVPHFSFKPELAKHDFSKFINKKLVLTKK